ncbi:MAG: helix-turn-helix domain-containing protein [Salinivirgaceae bacterium]
MKAIKIQLEFLKKSRNERLKENWIDAQEVLIALNISKRTLQTMRDNGSLPFSRINGKFYYKVADLEKLLESNYSNSKVIGGRHGAK